MARLYPAKVFFKVGSSLSRLCGKRINAKHRIQVNDPFEFSGPNGRRDFTVEGVAVIAGQDVPNWGKTFYLVDVITPFEMDGEKVKQLILITVYRDNLS